jgi:hypothetical protein
MTDHTDIVERLSAEFERGRQQGIQQERALWELAKSTQEIDSQPEPSDTPSDEAEFTGANFDQRTDVIGLVREALAAQPEPSAQGEPVAWIKRSIYHKAEQYMGYLAARFPRDGSKSTSGTFWWEGHNWRYLHTSFDDIGDFDVITRPNASAPSTPPPAVVEAVPLTVIDALRRLWPAIEKAMGCLVFTAEQAGAVQADMNTVRRGIAPKAAQEPKA